MWPSRRSMRGQRNQGRGGEGPKLPNFFFLPSFPLPFQDVFCESLFFRIKMASAVKRSRTVALSVERVLESLEQKRDGNDGMSSGEESENVRIKSRGLKHPYEAQENTHVKYIQTDTIRQNTLTSRTIGKRLRFVKEALRFVPLERMVSSSVDR